MRSATIVVAALASMATALPSIRATGSAVANIDAVNGFGDNQSKTSVQIPFGQLTHFDLEITGLNLKSITVTVPDITPPDLSQIICQMYQDQYGIQQGSAPFTSTRPALISTNPVRFGWVLCYVDFQSA